MKNKSKQNNEELEKKIYNLLYKNSSTDSYSRLVYEDSWPVEELAECMRQQRQEAYDEGLLHGTDLQVHLNKVSNFPAVSKQAVKEFAEELKQQGSALVIVDEGKCLYSKQKHTKGDLFISVESINKALEVYEGK